VKDLSRFEGHNSFVEVTVGSELWRKGVVRKIRDGSNTILTLTLSISSGSA